LLLPDFFLSYFLLSLQFINNSYSTKTNRIMGKIIDREKRTIAFMIRLYCRHRLHQQEPSEEYRALIDYCQHRLDHCRWQDEKPACKHCPCHCYAPAQRECVRQIMRWTGPRMILYAPLEVLRHLLNKG
jgi:Rieske Fe-S protein